MFLPPPLTQQVASIFYNEDIHCRGELRRRILVSERDYVSAFCAGLRRQFSPATSLFIHKQTLPGGAERKLGADAILIVQYDGQCKIAFYESKWPRILFDPNYEWDYLNNNNSHLTDQLNRQQIFTPKFAFWETFYYEGSPGFDAPPFDFLGSSNSLQKDALIHANDNGLTTAPWTNNNLRSLLRHKGFSLYQVMLMFLSCRIGRIFKVEMKFDLLRNPVIDTGRSSPLIPLPIKSDNNIIETNESIERFMKENDLSVYNFIDCTFPFINEASSK